MKDQLNDLRSGHEWICAYEDLQREFEGTPTHRTQVYSGTQRVGVCAAEYTGQGAVHVFHQRSVEQNEHSTQGRSVEDVFQEFKVR